MAVRKPSPVVTLPPKTAAHCWAEFLKWCLGVPVVVAGGLAIIFAGLWLTGGQEMAWQAVSGMGTALVWIGAIALMYPAMLFVWVSELRVGLGAARDWAALSPEEQAAALAAVPRPKRKRG